MPPQEYNVTFFGALRIAELNGVTIEEGQIIGSNVLASKIINNTKGGIFITDGLKTPSGLSWNWPPLEEAIWGRVKDIEVNPRATTFTLEAGVHGSGNIISNCPEGCMHVLNIYWNPETDEIVIKTEEQEE